MYSLDNRHSLALPYWARPGLSTFAKHDDAGGGKDEDDDDDDDDDDDEDDDPDADKDEATIRAELRAVRQQLKGVNGQSAKRRAKLKDLTTKLEQAQADKVTKGKRRKDDDDDDELDVEAIREQARIEGRKAGDDRVKTAEVRTALSMAGVNDPKALTRLARMVDLTDLDLNDDGTVDGIDDAIDELKADMPALFKPRRKRESIAGEGDRDGSSGSGARKAKTPSEQQAATLLGRGRS